MRLDFGDGDFFAIDPLGTTPGRTQVFAWRFLGVGPTDEITWQLAESENGCVFAVRDHHASRTREEAVEMVEGWSDFLGRLAGYVTTGRRTRYHWRHEIDGAATLCDPDAPLLEEPELYRWLPVQQDGTGRTFQLDGEGTPSAFGVVDWRLGPGRELSFATVIPGAARPPACTVRLLQRGQRDTRIRFAHTGWAARDLGLPEEQCLALRRRFATTWQAALSSIERC